LRNVSDIWQAIINQTEAQDPSEYLPPQYTGILLEGYKAQHAIVAERYASSKSAVAEFAITLGASQLFILSKPLSRGSININPADPYGEPIVDFNTLSNPIDTKILIEGFKYARKFISMPSNQELGATESNATLSITTDTEIENLLKASLNPTESHPSCTNAMMPERLGGVVGPDLLVHGVSHLSVVDASIMPMIPAAHLSSTVYAVAEKVSWKSWLSLRVNANGDRLQI
jgi:choline dehydrogenase-like flavoprotein